MGGKKGEIKGREEGERVGGRNEGRKASREAERKKIYFDICKRLLHPSSSIYVVVLNVWVARVTIGTAWVDKEDCEFEHDSQLVCQLLSLL